MALKVTAGRNTGIYQKVSVSSNDQDGIRELLRLWVDRMDIDRQLDRIEHRARQILADIDIDPGAEIRMRMFAKILASFTEATGPLEAELADEKRWHKVLADEVVELSDEVMQGDPGPKKPCDALANRW